MIYGEVLNIQDTYHVVLVEPDDSLNIGAVARAMKNFGFASLHLVAPRHFEKDRAYVSACWAADVIDSATVHQTFSECLGQFQSVVGFTNRKGKNRMPRLLLPNWAQAVEPEVITALVFGPEETGLRQEHIDLCSRLVTIPANHEFPSFNLSQAVLLALAELARRSWPDFSTPKDRSNHADFTQLDLFLDDLMKQSEFLTRGTPAEIPGAMKQLFRRIEPSIREMRILLGFFSRLTKKN